jgi:hypothetical protein
VLLGLERVQPVAVDAVRPSSCLDGVERSESTRRSAAATAAPVATDVVAVHRLGEHHVAGRVEPADELGAVVVEVGLTANRPPPPSGSSPPGVATEARLELLGAAVAPVREPPGEREPGDRCRGARVESR